MSEPVDLRLPVATGQRIPRVAKLTAPRDIKTAIISIEDLGAEALPELTRAFQAVAGVKSVDYSLERGVAVVEFDPNQSRLDDLLRAVLKAGYKVL